jgi:hypothetical protein
MNTLKQLIKLQCKEILMEAAAAAQPAAAQPAAAAQKPGLLARAGAAIKNVFGGGAQPAAAGAQPVAQAAAATNTAAAKTQTAAAATVAGNTKAVAAGGAKEQLEPWQTDWLDPNGGTQGTIGDNAKKSAHKAMQDSVNTFIQVKDHKDAQNKKPKTEISDEVGTLVAKAALTSFVKRALEEKDAEIKFESTVLLGTILYGRRK